ncbi:MAG: histidine phosphatase family protein [Lactobacillus sp.]|nr:histidine phosphatase family protein [Lactobacillus sp.]
MWYIFRHGETLHNKNKIRQGRCQSMLSLKGIDQAKSYAYRLLEQNEDLTKYKILTSPMVRTRETAQIICEIPNINAYEKIKQEELLNASDIGKFTDTPFEIVKKKYSKDLYEINDLWTYRYPDGESFNDVYKRMLDFVDKYSQEKDLLIITHGCCFVFLQNILLNKRKESITLDMLRPSQNYFLKWDGNEIVLA